MVKWEVQGPEKTTERKREGGLGGLGKQALPSFPFSLRGKMPGKTKWDMTGGHCNLGGFLA